MRSISMTESNAVLFSNSENGGRGKVRALTPFNSVSACSPRSGLSPSFEPLVSGVVLFPHASTSVSLHPVTVTPSAYKLQKRQGGRCSERGVIARSWFPSPPRLPIPAAVSTAAAACRRQQPPNALSARIRVLSDRRMFHRMTIASGRRSETAKSFAFRPTSSSRDLDDI